MRTATLNCPCCPVTTPCNPSPVPRTLPLVVTFRCTQFSVTLRYFSEGSSEPGGQWNYVLLGDPIADIDICPQFRFRDLALSCNNGVWSATLVYSPFNPGTGTWLQFEATTPDVTAGGGLTAITVVSTNPLCLTLTSNSVLDLDCGSGILYLAIGSGCAVIPACCNWGSLPATATATYTLGALAPATRSLSAFGNSYGDNGFSCTVGDGTSIVISFLVDCDSCRWGISITVSHLQLSPFVVLKTMQWDIQNIVPGTVRSDGTTFNCSPFHAHMSILNTTGPASSSTVTCGGKAYPFGPVGTVNAILDVVTP